MWSKLSAEERTIFRRITIVMAASYPVLVAVAAGVNWTVGHLLPGFARASWPELLYGPAITLVCVWAMVVLEVWIRLRFRRG